MDINLIRAAVTIMSMLVFVGIAYWAYAPRNRERFDADALIPFEADHPVGSQR